MTMKWINIVALGVLAGSLVSAAAQEAPERGRPMGGPPQDRPVVRPLVELRQKLEQMRQKLRALEAAQQMDDAAVLRKEIAELERQARPQARPQVQVQPRQDPEERIRVLKQEIKELRKKGHGGKRGEFSSARRNQDRQQPGMQQPGNPDERERRLQHLRVAIDNLRAAGMNPAADRLQQMIGNMRQGGQPPMGQPAVPGLRRGPGPGAGPGQGMNPMWGMVKERMEQLQAQIQELQQNLKALRQRLDQPQRDGGAKY